MKVHTIKPCTNTFVCYNTLVVFLLSAGRVMHVDSLIEGMDNVLRFLDNVI